MCCLLGQTGPEHIPAGQTNGLHLQAACDEGHQSSQQQSEDGSSESRRPAQTGKRPRRASIASRDVEQQTRRAHYLTLSILLVRLQLFWEKKLSGLSAYDIAEELMKTMELPKGLQGDPPATRTLLVHTQPYAMEEICTDCRYRK